MRVALLESFIKPWELALLSSVVGPRSYEFIEKAQTATCAWVNTDYLGTGRRPTTALTLPPGTRTRLSLRLPAPWHPSCQARRAPPCPGSARGCSPSEQLQGGGSKETPSRIRLSTARPCTMRSHAR